MPDFVLRALELLRYVSVVVSLVLLTVAVVLWAKGIGPVLLRLGMGLARRKIAVFARGDMAGSLARIIQEGSDFGRKTKASAWYKWLAHRHLPTTEALT